nr:MAG TPA: repressor [Inoviridae sp.]
MPSSKPVVVIRTNEELIRKLDILAKKEKRSRSNLCELIVSNWVDENFVEDQGNKNADK